MMCPKCECKTKVIDSRTAEEAVMRKRRCTSCGHEFYTEEFESEDHEGLKYIWAMNARKRRNRNGKNL